MFLNPEETCFLTTDYFFATKFEVAFIVGTLSMEIFPLLFTGTLRGLFFMETFSLSMETFPLYGDFTGTLLYGDFFSVHADFFSLRGLYGNSSLWRLFLCPWRLFLFTGTLRGLFSMETFSLYGDFTGTLRGLFSMETFSLSMETFSLYGDFTGTLLYGDFFSVHGEFFSLRGLYGDFTGTLLYGDFFSVHGDFFSLRALYGDSSLWRLFLCPWRLFLFTGTLRVNFHR